MCAIASDYDRLFHWLSGVSSVVAWVANNYNPQSHDMYVNTDFKCETVLVRNMSMDGIYLI